MNAPKNRNLINIVSSLRLKQWIKNLLIFTPLFFSGQVDNPELLIISIQGFLAFSFVASSTYLINDLIDREVDKNHPRKRNRPIAKGELTPSKVITVATLLSIFGSAWAFFLNILFFLILLSYFLITLSYHLWLKNIAVLDVLTVTIGYLLRIGAGSILVKVEPSPWLLLVTFSLAMFIVVAKRKGELKQVKEKSRRLSLKSYSEGVINSMLYTSATLTITSYALYAFTSTSNPVTNRFILWLSIVPVIFGAFRYLYIVEQENKGEEPEEELFKDIPLLVSVIIWVIIMGLAFYLPPLI